MNKNIAKISNEMLEAYIRNSNLIALKILMYISKSDRVPVQQVHELENNVLVNTSISVKDLLEYCNIDKKTLDRNIKKMTETSIRLEDEKGYRYVNITPWAEFEYSGYLKISVFAIILKLTHALEKYSLIDVQTLASLTKQHSTRMLMILERINNFGENVAKRKRYTLEELNEMFDTKYKTIPEFERAVLKPAKEELDNNSKLSFIYQTRKDKLERTVGRAKVVEVIIDLIDRKDYQPKLF